MERQASPQTVVWFSDLRSVNRLNMEPPYQRASVWNMTFRRYFIDTILRNYPCPAVFLVREYREGDIKPCYAVVDGKQRLTSVFAFLDGEFATQRDDGNPDISEKYFAELPEEYKRRFLDYSITVEMLGNAGVTELKEAFDRMNRNVSRLNPQELRHAKYDGEFITMCESLAKAPFWDDSSIATQRRQDRMSDIEFISELVVLTERGPQNGKAVLDEVYAKYDEEIPNEETLRKNYQMIMDALIEIGLSATGDAPFGKPVDIYSLWAALREFLVVQGRKLDVQASRVSLAAFAQRVEVHADEDAITYYENAQRQTNSLGSRNKRASVVLKCLVAKDETA